MTINQLRDLINTNLNGTAVCNGKRYNDAFKLARYVRDLNESVIVFSDSKKLKVTVTDDGYQSNAEASWI